MEQVKEQKIGILIKSAESLELLHTVDTVILDKTGTITKGKPKVTRIISDIDEKQLLKIAGSLEKNSEHPLSKAVIEKVQEQKIELLEVENFKSVSGRGVKGNIDKIEYIGGNISFIKENNIDTRNFEKESEKLLAMGETVLYFADNKKIIGIIAVADQVKEQSVQAIEELKKRNIDVIMVTRR